VGAQEDDSPVSVFKANPPAVDDPRWELAKAGAKRLKLVRVPFLSTVVTQNQP